MNHKNKSLHIPVIFILCISALLTSCGYGQKIASGESVVSSDFIEVKANSELSTIGCIVVGNVKDLSNSRDFLWLDKKLIVRQAIFGRLSLKPYRGVKLSVVDRVLMDRKFVNNQEILKQLGCDAILSAKIIEFENEFYVTYSSTKVAIVYELRGKGNEIIWTKETGARSDAGTIPLSPVGVATGLFFATKNREEEIALRLVDSVVRKGIDSLPDFFSKTGAAKVKLNVNEIQEDRVGSKIEKSLKHQKVSQMIERQDYSASLKKCKRLIESDPQDHHAMFLAGKSALGLKLNAEAVNYFETAIVLSPTDSSYYSGLGLALLKQDNLDKARHAFDKALGFDKYHVVALSGVGDILRKEGKNKKAATFYFSAGLSSLRKENYPEAVAALKAINSLPKTGVSIDKGKKLRQLIAFNRKSLRN